jgi:predicted transcriptional regulator
MLEALISNPLPIEQLAFMAQVEVDFVRKGLEFLVKNGLVDVRGRPNRHLYAVTERGVAVLKILNFPKYLDKIANNIRLIDEAQDIIKELKKEALEETTRDKK